MAQIQAQIQEASETGGFGPDRAVSPWWALMSGFAQNGQISSVWSEVQGRCTVVRGGPKG